MSNEKFKIILEYIKDLSVETPNATTLLSVRENISKYNLDIDISSMIPLFHWARLMNIAAILPLLGLFFTESWDDSNKYPSMVAKLFR